MTGHFLKHKIRGFRRMNRSKYAMTLHHMLNREGSKTMRRAAKLKLSPTSTKKGPGRIHIDGWSDADKFVRANPVPFNYRQAMP
jgi:hypothetical protein